MTALNREQQKNNPTWTIVGGDRVHPGAPGHLMMAWLFLKSQNAPAAVSAWWSTRPCPGNRKRPMPR